MLERIRDGGGEKRPSSFFSRAETLLWLPAPGGRSVGQLPGQVALVTLPLLGNGREGFGYRRDVASIVTKVFSFLPTYTPIAV